jgi:VWFA-related protein
MLNLIRIGRVRYVLLLLAFFPLLAAGQDGQSQPAAPDANFKSDAHAAVQQTPKSVPELASNDSPAVFRVRTNAVLVRVVVRDQKGNAVENLKKEDFRLFDNKKLQTINTFTVEHPASHEIPGGAEAGSGKERPNSAAVPQRFVALVLDDIHFRMEDAVFVRESAAKILDRLTAFDRVAIFSTSGKVSQDFTSDKNALRNTLSKVIPRPIPGGPTDNCPYISYFQADQILNFDDKEALGLAVNDLKVCEGSPAIGVAGGPSGSGQVMADARLVEIKGDEEAEVVSQQLQKILKRLSTTPGRRTLAFISAGYYSRKASEDLADIIDRAVRADVIVDTVDALGLVASDRDHVDFETAGGQKQMSDILTFRMQEQALVSGLLGELADGTGGNFFHHRNDLDRGIGQAVTAPPVSYVLGFSPQNLRLDGSSHTLKVTLENSKGLSIEARHSYRAPKTLQDPAERADQEILEALTSRDEVNDIPVELRTQFFKKDSTDANLSVLAHVSTQTMHFRKEGDRHLDNLTMETAIFDQDGKFVNGGKKVITMNLTDTTLEKLNRSGLSVKSSFDLKPGTYLIRLVLRDTEGAQMAARNGSVEIPF